MINISLFDVLSVSFAKLLEKFDVQECSDFGKIKNKDQLNNIVVGLLNDFEFSESISKGTNGKKAVDLRYNMVNAKILKYQGEKL